MPKYAKNNLKVHYMRSKISGLEASLTHVVREFEEEKYILLNKTKEELDELKSVTTVLKSALQKRTEEIRKVKVNNVDKKISF